MPRHGRNREEASDCSSNSSQICADEYIVDCSGMHCCEKSRIGDGICDSETTSTCDLTCYNSDGDDCGCPDGTLLNCSGSGSCVDKRLLGDGRCHEDLICYNNDDNDCAISTECPEFRGRDELFEAVTQYIELGRLASTEHPCGDINTWDVSQITDMSKLFCGNTWAGCPSDRTEYDVDIRDWDTSSVTNFDMMFYGASRFNGMSCRALKYHFTHSFYIEIKITLLYHDR